MYVCANCSTAPGVSTMKKFGRNESQCTVRALVSFAVKGSPPMEYVISSPISSPIALTQLVLE